MIILLSLEVNIWQKHQNPHFLMDNYYEMGIYFIFPVHKMEPNLLRYAIDISETRWRNKVLKLLTWGERFKNLWKRFFIFSKFATLMSAYEFQIAIMFTGLIKRNSNKSSYLISDRFGNG